VEDAADPLLAGLNPEQQQAVRHQGPPLVVQAGPGTGKTRALTHRLAYLLARRQTPPEQILALTFTRQAAGEMEDRIRRLLPDYAGLPQLTIKTFHALGHQMLLAHQSEAPRQVADEETRRGFLRQAARDRGLPAGRLDGCITRWKQALIYPEDLIAGEDPEAAAAFRHYEAALAREGLWDYEDLIARPTRLLHQQPQLQESYRRRYRHLLVDEYQDLNEAQYRLFLALAGPQAEIMVIGDPHQAIYGFRGAAPVYFQRFRQDFRGAMTLAFRETYRLPPPILQAAHQALGPDPDVAPLISRRQGEQPLALLELPTAAGEAAAIAREIERLVGGLSHLALEDAGLRHQEGAEKAGFRDVAVLYRLHALGPELERCLTAAGIPCQLPREGVGPEWDGLDLAAEKVKLLTLHASKGLEFPYVFIAGCENGLLPWEPEGQGYADAAEERRLFYVGLTRASRQVFLSRARVRTLWGKRRRTQLSPLVQAISPDLLQRRETSGAASRPAAQQPHLFPEIKAPKAKRGR
jgi:DNA helicase-2/ATP-dependent DNA helicase PcrA